MEAKKAKTLQDYCREWFDTLVVAVSVAMAFRAYFFEPFNIPTGSMQPTLYGNHTEPCPEPGLMETTPLKWLNWLFSGRDYKDFVAPFDGEVYAYPRNDGRCSYRIQSATGQVGPVVTLPTDARLYFGPLPERTRVQFVPLSEAGSACVAKQVTETGLSRLTVKAGHRLWQGYDTSGDFIFVNRWHWNFRQPARGDVMVFSTQGIGRVDTGAKLFGEPITLYPYERTYPGTDGGQYLLQQKTHYIKRLTGLPGETVEIRRPDVFINGERIDPIKPMTGERGEPTPQPNNGGDRSRMKGPVTLGPGEYLACGDNSDNSLDSRYWGPVPERNLKGTGSVVFWPIINPRWGIIK